MSDAWNKFSGSAASTNAALTNQSVQAAPGAGKSLIVRQIIFSNEGTANSFALLNGSGGANVLGSVIYLGANQSFTYKLFKPYKLTANTALVVTTTASDHASVIAEGSVE